jgi:hypothetical protein
MNPPATAGKSAVNRAPSLVYQALPFFGPELQLGAATGGVACSTLAHVMPVVLGRRLSLSLVVFNAKVRRT